LKQYEEIEDEEGPDDAVAVQIIFEQVRENGRSFIRQIKIYHNETDPVEIISKAFENWRIYLYKY